MPKMSTRPGNFDTHRSAVQSEGQQFVLDPVRIPSLRGARTLRALWRRRPHASSLRRFRPQRHRQRVLRTEPSPHFDAIVAYIQEYRFPAESKPRPGGHLVGKTSESNVAARRCSQNRSARSRLECAGCHVPSAPSPTTQQHDVGSGGLFTRRRPCATPISMRRIFTTVA